jgi:hypothetical protein
MSWILMLWIGYSGGSGQSALDHDKVEFFSESECLVAAETHKREAGKTFNRVVAYCVKRDLGGLRKAYD